MLVSLKYTVLPKAVSLDMDTGTIISFTIANALTSCLGAYLVRKKHPEVGFVKLAACFFVGYIVFFWGLAQTSK